MGRCSKKKPVPAKNSIDISSNSSQTLFPTQKKNSSSDISEKTEISETSKQSEPAKSCKLVCGKKCKNKLKTHSADNFEDKTDNISEVVYQKETADKVQSHKNPKTKKRYSLQKLLLNHKRQRNNETLANRKRNTHHINETNYKKKKDHLLESLVPSKKPPDPPTKTINKKEKCIYKWKWRKIQLLIGGSYALNCFALMYSFCLLYAAVKTKLRLGKFINMVSEGEGTTISICLGVGGTLCIILNVIFIFGYFKVYQEKRLKKWNLFLFSLIIVGLCMVVVLLALAIFALTHAYSIHHGVHDGLKEAMNNYKTDLKMKYIIDVLQSTFQCCGSKSYSEWFNIPWFDTSIESVESEIKVRDDTPFSCCLRLSHYPCIHHDIMSVGSSYLYAPESNLSISEHGCHTILIKQTKVVAWRTAGAMFLLSLFEIVICVTSRLIQTGHREFYMFERHNHIHTCWLFGSYKKHKNLNVVPEPPPWPDEKE